MNVSLHRRSIWSSLLLLGLALGCTGCADESLMGPDATNDTFTRYVALGNSITAGFQSGGIAATTQEEAYPVLLAEQMNTRFEIPRLRAPGCPPPVDNIFAAALTGPSIDCGLRSSPTPTVLNNVAVPGAEVIDALTNDIDRGANPGFLTTFILGGRTQVQAAAQVNPTFASVWLGNNDALRAALAGGTGSLTPASAFESRITQVVDSLVSAGADRGVLVGVANPNFIPALSPGQAYAAAEPALNQFGQRLAGSNWGGYSVAGSCEPGGSGASTRVPFLYGFGTLFRRALQGQSVQLVCDPNAAPPPLLTPAEQATVSARVQAYNATLSSLADENGWAYVPVNPFLQALYAANAGDGNPANDLVPKFPRPPSSAPPADDAPPTFGRYYSEDGIHPSSTTHRVVTFAVIQALNQQYDDVQLEQISIPDEAAALLSQ